ncbi:MAG TPA: alpha/beta hydrolase [Vicinamibacterales bacterium]|nr:alpha/beta hydrolase [Vicinamibacterales bacterium]
MTRLLAILAIAALFVLVLWVGQRHLIYLPFGSVAPPAGAGLPDAEAVSFPTDDGLTLNAWFVPAAGSPRPPTVIVFSGNAGNRAFRAPLAAALRDAGIQTLLLDYRGYGGNPGSPSEEGLALDVRAARRYVANRPDVDARRLVYFGESLGSGPAVRLAIEQPPLALILRSPYTSLIDLGRLHYPYLPVGLLLRDRFPSLERIPRVRCPVLVIAARGDTIVPSSQSERLHAAVTAPKRLLLLEGDHNDYELLAGPRLIAAVVDFLRALG